MTTQTFEEQYQAQFAPMAEKFPIGSEVVADGKVYKVTDYEISGYKQGVVGVDREGNEKSLYDFEAVKYKVCSRCGGSGRYSYNQIHGSRCYGCSGLGKQILAPTGFPQKLKGVCTVELKKFGFAVGEEMKGEFCKFSNTGGTPVYTTGKGMLLHATILKHFEVK